MHGHPCAVKNCYRPSRPRSPFCLLHEKRHAKTGTASGSLLHPNVVRGASHELRPVLDRYRNHPSVLTASQVMGQLLDGIGADNEREAFWLRHVRDGGVTGYDALLVMLTTWAIHQANPDERDDGKVLDSSLGHALLCCVPSIRIGKTATGGQRYRRPTPAVWKRLGKRLRPKFAPLLQRLYDIAEAEHRARERLRRTLSGPALQDLGAEDLERANRAIEAADALAQELGVDLSADPEPVSRSSPWAQQGR